MPDRIQLSRAKPIIFSAPMVKALLAGRKTQTRRTAGLADVNIQPAAWSLNNIGPLGYMAKPSVKGKFGATFESRRIEPRTISICPQKLSYRRGDRLYVREAWRAAPAHDDLAPSAMGGEEPIRYEADGVWEACGWTMPNGPGGRLRSSIHMPRWASRLRLAVTDVRVQRLQDISEADAVAEGCLMDPEPDEYGGHMPAEIAHELGGDQGWDCARDWFADLWNSIHGPDAWEANPWVVAVSFDVIRRNIDA